MRPSKNGGITYGDELSDRDTAMKGIPQREYDALKEAFFEELSSQKQPLV